MKTLRVVLLLVVAIIIVINLLRMTAVSQRSDPASNVNVSLIVGDSNLPNVNGTSTHHSQTNKIYSCSSDSDCSLVATNCYSSNAGSNWECLNKNSYVDCGGGQVLSPQTNANCVCQNSVCTAK